MVYEFISKRVNLPLPMLTKKTGHVIRKDISVNDRWHIRWWPHRIIMVLKNHLVIVALVMSQQNALQLPTIFSIVTCSTGL